MDYNTVISNPSPHLTILLLGGTGAMGVHLVHILADHGNEVYVTSRKKYQSIDNIHYIQGDAHDMEFLRYLLAERYYDALVDFMVYSTEEFNMRKELLLSTVGQYVYLSSARVYADSKTPILEDSPRLLDVCKMEEYLNTEEYALIKACQENMLKESVYGNWTIIRPYITYSETRLQLGVMEKESWLYRALHGRSIVFSKDIYNKYTTLTYGYNVSEGIAAIIGQSAALGEVFHITQPEAIKWREVQEVYLDVIEEKKGRRPRVLLTNDSLNLRKDWAQWQVRLDRHYNRLFDNSKISKFIDTDHFVPPYEGLRKCLECFIANPYWNAIIPANNDEILKDKLTNEIASFSEFPNLKSYIKYLIKRFVYPKSKL